MSQEYHYARDGQQLGPVTLRELQDLLRQNRLAPTDLVWTEGMSDWKPAAEIPGLVNQVPVVTASRPAAAPTPRASLSEQTPPSVATGSIATGTGGKLLVTARDLSLRVLANVRSTAVATAGHLNQFVACVMARGKTKLAQRDAVRQRAAYGQKMYAAGLGDADNRRIIDDIGRRIRNAQSAGHSQRSLEQELQAAHAAIAESALESDQAPAGLEREFEAARLAGAGFLSAQQAAADRRNRLRTMQSNQGLRIGIGYACAFLVISSMVLAARGTSRSAANSNVPNQPENIVDNNQAGQNGGGGDDGTFVPDPAPVPELVQDNVPANQQSTCQNCYGTGQANCLQCFGTGKRSCFMCNGMGKTVNNLQCFQCNGTGRQNCSFCTYGKVQCPQCFGSGRR